jgi:hypothetical protein
MFPILTVWLLGLQSDMAQEVTRLSSDRIEDRHAAAEHLKSRGRVLRDAALLWAISVNDAEEPVRARLDRIGRCWSDALAANVPMEKLPPEDPQPVPVELDELHLKMALRLCSTRLTIRMTNASLSELIAICNARSGIRIRTIGIPDPGRIILNFEAEEQPIDAILSSVLKPRKLHTLLQDGVLLIGPIDRLRARISLQLYSVADLTPELPGEELLLQILRDVDPAEWNGDPDRWIEFQNDTLIVRNTTAVHRRLCRYLNRLRTTSPEDRPPPPDASLGRLFRELKGSCGEEAERRLSALGPQIAEALRRLAEQEESGDLDGKLQARELSIFLSERLNEELVRQVLQPGEPR